MLVALGINHKTAPFAVRQKIAFAKEHIQPALSHFLKASKLREAALLSTCNRTEFYCGSSDPAPIIHWWQNYLKITPKDLEPYLYCHANANAARHMMQVACGLDSMILGESQILGQLKGAFEIARQTGAMGKYLGRLFQSTFCVAKKIRSQTEIAQHPVSIAYAAAHLAKQIFTDISKTRVLLIGAGETIELTALHLCQLGIQQLTVANRSLAGAKRLAQRFGGSALSLKDIPDCLKNIDIVISSTASPHPILTADMVNEALSVRKRHPIFMVDLAMPCDIDPLVAKHEDVYLYTVDDLQSLVDNNKAARQKAAYHAQGIIDLEVSHYMAWLESQEAIRTLCLFRKKVDNLKDQELEKALRLLQRGAKPETIVQQLAHNLSQKFMHEPTIRLKAAGLSKESKMIDTVADLFNI